MLKSASEAIRRVSEPRVESRAFQPVEETQGAFLRAVRRRHLYLVRCRAGAEAAPGEPCCAINWGGSSPPSSPCDQLAEVLLQSGLEEDLSKLLVGPDASRLGGISKECMMPRKRGWAICEC